MIGCYEQHGEMMMCFVVAKDASKDGCVALRIAHGQALVNLKREIVGRIGYSHIQIMTISMSVLLQLTNILNVFVERFLTYPNESANHDLECEIDRYLE